MQQALEFGSGRCSDVLETGLSVIERSDWHAYHETEARSVRPCVACEPASRRPRLQGEVGRLRQRPAGTEVPGAAFTLCQRLTRVWRRHPSTAQGRQAVTHFGVQASGRRGRRALVTLAVATVKAWFNIVRHRSLNASLICTSKDNAAAPSCVAGTSWKLAVIP